MAGYHSNGGNVKKCAVGKHPSIFLYTARKNSTFKPFAAWILAVIISLLKTENRFVKTCPLFRLLHSNGQTICTIGLYPVGFLPLMRGNTIAALLPFGTKATTVRKTAQTTNGLRLLHTARRWYG